MRQKVFLAASAAAIAAGSIAAWANENPPPLDGNSGLPAALAEIDRLEAELDETRETLSITEAALAETQSELAATESELAETRSELVLKTAALETEKNTFRIAATGQKECWQSTPQAPRAADTIIPCAGTGQDGETQTGLAPPPAATRFIDNADGTITDTFTGLVWMKNAGCLDTKLTWQDALAFIKTINGGGGSGSGASVCGLLDLSKPGDWRMPNANELASLLHQRVVYGRKMQEGNPFIRWRLDVGYWTSTTYSLPFDAASAFPPAELEKIWLDSGRFRHGESLSRFGDAYVVNFRLGEISVCPKYLEEANGDGIDCGGWFIAVRDPK